jgi:hypothetical protein
MSQGGVSCKHITMTSISNAWNTYEQTQLNHSHFVDKSEYQQIHMVQTVMPNAICKKA